MIYSFLLINFLSVPTWSQLLSRQRRTWIIDSFEIEEGHPGPFPYLLGNVNVERRYRVLFELFGEGVNEEPAGVLSIDRESGNLYVHKAVDYEEKNALKLRFEAKKPDDSVDTKLGIEISIHDINDNPPRFQSDLYEITVNEALPQGSHLLTVLAYDRDQRGTANSTFHYEIKSVSPNLPDVKFFIGESGTISFKGCLNYEVTNRITMLVEAVDHGEVVQLSSSTTVIIHVQDGNNHLPIINGQTGTGKVKENESGSSPLRLHVTDKEKSKAWRVRYTIHGDMQGNFKVETDPETNDGILTVVKPLDFEEGALKELSVSVENEEPFFFCEVKERTSSGLWKVDHSTDPHRGGAGQSHSIKVLIEVQDANDPPMFKMAVTNAKLEENVSVGTLVERVLAVDPDSNSARKFVYKVGNDPAGWVKVDPQTGDVITTKTPDRESPYVVDGIYTVIMLAVDDDDPPLTGTTTLQIHVVDRNDNVPQPVSTSVDICESDDATTTNITAIDLDGNPFGGPFQFELLGDGEGKWKLDPTYGFSVGLVKKPGVYASIYTINMKISDLQGAYGVYHLNVTVCDCSERPFCSGHQNITTRASNGTVGIVLLSFLFLLLMLLMAVVISCEQEFTTIQTDGSSGETLLKFNIETPGTDCKVPSLVASANKKHRNQLKQSESRMGKFSEGQGHNFNKISRDFKSRHSSHQYNWNQTLSSHVAYDHSQQVEQMRITNINADSFSSTDAALLNLLHRRIFSVQEMEADSLVYVPHAYKEGDCEDFSEFDEITIPDEEEPLQKIFSDLGPQFNQLAAFCKSKHPQ